MVIIGNM